MPPSKPKNRLIVLGAFQEGASYRTTLEEDGHDVVMLSAVDDLWRTHRAHPADVIVLDLDLPDAHGLSVVRDLRAHSATGIVVLTARTDPMDRLIALEMGADHYLELPVTARELAVRVRNLLWRIDAVPASAGDGDRVTQFQFDGWLFDLDKRVLRHPEFGTSPLTRQEAGILHALVTHAGKVMSRDALMDAVNREWTPTDRTIDVLIRRLRRKIEPDPAAPELIVTIYGEGYLFAGTVV